MSPRRRRMSSGLDCGLSSAAVMAAYGSRVSRPVSWASCSVAGAVVSSVAIVYVRRWVLKVRISVSPTAALSCWAWVRSEPMRALLLALVTQVTVMGLWSGLVKLCWPPRAMCAARATDTAMLRPDPRCSSGVTGRASRMTWVLVRYTPGLVEGLLAGAGSAAVRRRL